MPNGNHGFLGGIDICNCKSKIYFPALVFFALCIFADEIIMVILLDFFFLENN